MTKLTKTTLFKTVKPRAETPMDKTTRAAREILDGEAERNQVKTARLRKARLEREVSAPALPDAKKPKGPNKNPRSGKSFKGK
jgi:hypothetical protein